MMAVRFENLKFSYGSLPVFRGLNLEIPRGSFTALVGKNGAGKSTLIKMMAGLVHPKEGKIQVLGLAPDLDSASLLSSVGYVSEDIAFYVPHLLTEILPIYRAIFPSWDPALEQRLLAQFGLEEKKSFLDLSRGQRMLFCFVLAASHRPSLYLIDEITSVLDPYNRKAVLDHVHADVKNGSTAIMATNIVAEIDGYADRVALVEGESRVMETSVQSFCAHFVKFRTPDPLDAHTVKKFGAVLVGAEGESILYVCRRDRLEVLRAHRVEPLHSAVSPMEAFLFLSKGAVH